MKKIYQVFLILVTITLPFFLVMASVRVLITPLFLKYEYSLPNFPADVFGFTTSDRLKWGLPSLVFLTNSSGIEFLQDLKFTNGTSIYNDRELSHMQDVKNLVQTSSKVWYGTIAFLILMLFIARHKKWMPLFWRSVAWGGWLTVFIILTILAAVLIDFDGLFTAFHRVFFTGNTWLFFETDTLIRLYPEKLWSDAFILMGVFTLIGTALSIFLGSKFSTEKQNRL